MNPDPPASDKRHGLRFAGAILATGVLAGLVGRLCVLALHLVEAIAWNRRSGAFLDAVTQASPLHRLLVLLLAGVIAGVSWTLMFRRDRGLVSVGAAVEGTPMPLARTLWHALTQILVVGLGASIGREVAPREISASLASWVGRRIGLSAEDLRILVACGAGAGLAAVYSIPLSGAVYTLEILLVALRSRTVAPAFAVSAIAVLVSTGWERPAPFYTVPHLEPSASLVCWALIMGPFIGWLGVLFRRTVHSFESARPRDRRLLATLPLGFGLVGLVAIGVPSVLGNGQASAQTQFDAEWLGGAGLGLALLVLAAKAFTTLLTIRVGGWGGTLTPAVALGAGLGAVTGLAWSWAWPGTSIAAFVFIGAAVFLGASMKAPFTGLVLVLEFTQQGAQILVPTALAIGAAVAATAWAERSAPDAS
ncbi:chloride channel protein [Schaalia hyovaginalis]|uniref:CIC family chloride channel protein n=1 Tax=Schaalia hyovaginalis TaxID=29316 RepID=A0A923IY10_9ACTO|nr:CIC family chloride channel protein [Schaalia hyovaginalis]